MMMKKRGRFVVEAAYLVPLICTLLVSLVFFALYAHDYAVCAHAAIECGVKELCGTGQTDGEIQEQIRKGLEQKLPERLLWLQGPSVTVEVGVLSAKIRISGTGKMLPVEGISFEQTLSRVNPCETVRRIKWLGE